MSAYSWLNLLVLAAALLLALCAAAWLRRRGRPLRWAAVAIAATGVLLLTLLFDNVMIAFGLFSYTPEQISGLHLGLVPLEDFAYPLVAALLVPILWQAFAGRGEPEQGSEQ